MKNFGSLIRLGVIPLIFILALVSVSPAASQTTVTRVIVTSVNANDAFPDIQVQFRALDAAGAFVPNLDASQFSLQEDGTSLAIEEVTATALPLNMRMIFVIDELSITSRLPAVREAIQAFAQNEMQPGDSVEVLAADGQGETQVIVPLTDDPAEVINGIQPANYNPSPASSTELLDAVKQGLDDLSTLSENTDGINQVVVFSVSLINQIDLDETIQEAVELGVPIHTVLLGSEDAEGALGRLARETGVVGGAIVTEDLTDVFETLGDQREQDQYLITYRSRAEEAGEHEVIIEVGGTSSNAVTFEINELELPRVQITDPAANTVITRTETFFNQNSETIEPTEQTIAVEVSWPDGHPRNVVVEKTMLVLNGKSLGPATAVRDNGKDPVVLEFTWDLREEKIPGQNQISIVVEAEDELGLKNKSEPVTVTVDYVLFAKGDGANACPALVSEYAPALCSNWNLIAPLTSLIVAVAALIIVVVFMRRNPQVQQKVKERLGTMMTNMTNITGMVGGDKATRIVEPLEASKAVLVVLEGKSGTKQTEFRINKSTSLGHSSAHADLAFQTSVDNSPISRSHCTLIERDDSFELQDHSTNGTFLNGTRLKAGQTSLLKDGDTIELARVQDGGIKFKFQIVSPPGYMGTRLVEPSSDDQLSKDGYTPTKIIK